MQLRAGTAVGGGGGSRKKDDASIVRMKTTFQLSPSQRLFLVPDKSPLLQNGDERLQCCDRAKFHASRSVQKRQESEILQGVNVISRPTVLGSSLPWRHQNPFCSLVPSHFFSPLTFVSPSAVSFFRGHHQHASTVPCLNSCFMPAFHPLCADPLLVFLFYFRLSVY